MAPLNDSSTEGGRFVCLCPPKSVDIGADGHVVRGDSRSSLQQELEALPVGTSACYAHLPGGAFAFSPAVAQDHSAATVGEVMTVFRGRLENYAYLVKKYCANDLDCKSVAWKGLNEIKAAAPVSAASLLCRLYQLLGKEMVAKLRGEFAFVTYDSHLVRVLAARDPSGKIELVHGRCSNGMLVVASGVALPSGSEVYAMSPGFFKYGWYSKSLKYANELQTVQRGASDATNAALKALAGIRKTVAGKKSTKKVVSSQQKTVVPTVPTPATFPARPAPVKPATLLVPCDTKQMSQSSIASVIPSFPVLDLTTCRPPASLLETLVEPMKADIRQANLLNTMLDTQSTAVVITDARQDDQPIVYANPIFELYSGYSQEEVLGKNCRFLQAPPGKPRVPSFTSMSLKRKIQNGVPMNVRLLNYHKNGTPMWNDLSLVPLRNESGEVTHFVGLQTFRSIGPSDTTAGASGTPMCASPRGQVDSEAALASPALRRVGFGFNRSSSCNTLSLLHEQAVKAGSYSDLVGLAAAHGVAC